MKTSFYFEEQPHPVSNVRKVLYYFRGNELVLENVPLDIEMKFIDYDYRF